MNENLQLRSDEEIKQRVERSLGVISPESEFDEIAGNITKARERLDMILSEGLCDYVFDCSHALDSDKYFAEYCHSPNSCNCEHYKRRRTN